VARTVLPPVGIHPRQRGGRRADEEIGEIARGTERTLSAIDRSVEPPYGDPPSLTAPDVWQAELGNGVRVYGIDDREVPLVQLELRMKGGQLLEEPGRTGVSNLLAESMMAGRSLSSPMRQ
jgi:zinc protease